MLLVFYVIFIPMFAIAWWLVKDLIDQNANHLAFILASFLIPPTITIVILFLIDYA